MTDQTIHPGKFVSLVYRIADTEGEILEQNDIPVNYIYGGDQELIGSMDAAVRGKRAGDVVEVIVQPEDGFGSHDPALTFVDDIDNVPPQFRKVGAEVQMQNDEGEVKSFFVRKIENGKLTVDGNHPLAGKTLKIRVEIKEVREATPADYENSGGSCSIN